MRSIVARRPTWLFLALFFGAWTLAWLLHAALGPALRFETQPLRASTYWQLMKLLFWVGLPWLYFCKSADTATASTDATLPGLRQFRGLALWRGLRTGLLFALAWASVDIGVSLAAGMRFHPTQGAWHGFVSAVLLSPAFEELMFRGYILAAFIRDGLRPLPSIVITALLFVAIHCVGWWFMGSFQENLLTHTAASIFLLALNLGWARLRGGSVIAPFIVHFVNNLIAAWLG